MLELVKDYYGRQLSGTADLKTTACCDISELPDWLKPLLARVHPEVRVGFRLADGRSWIITSKAERRLLQLVTGEIIAASLA